MRKFYLLILASLFISGAVNAQRKPAKVFPLKQLPAQEPGITTVTGCRTLNYPIPDWVTPVIYLASEGGFVAGSNVYGDKQKANYFEINGPKYGYIVAAKFFFGVAGSNNAENLQKNLYVRVFDVNTDGNPGNELYAKSVKFSRIASVTANGQFLKIAFDSAVQIPVSRKFFISIDISNLVWTATTRDSISLITSEIDQIVPGQGWEQWSDDTWYDMNTAWSGFNVALSIFPVISETSSGCSQEVSASSVTNAETKIVMNKNLASVKFENPFNGALKVRLNLASSQTVSAKVYDMQGRLTAMEKPALFSAVSSSFVLNSTANLRSGMYILKLNVGSEEHSFKIVKQ